MQSDLAIVIPSFNRQHSLKRILRSVENADYSGYVNINLIISIDGGGGDEILMIANQFQWLHGQKRIIKFENNIGLRKHIIACGELTSEYGNVIILEDDCFVSRNFYDYASQALEFYNNDPKIAGISLYAYQINENALLPFVPLSDGYASYFMQVPSSWGQVWTNQQWIKFKAFWSNDIKITGDDQLPENVKKWSESSWKKYYYKYMVDKDLYFVYPAISLLTNFGDMGTHYDYEVPYFQVPLETRSHSLNYSFVDFQGSFNKYDAYFEMLPACLNHFGVQIKDKTCVDIFGTKQLELFDCNYVYSIRACTQPIKSFAVVMFPLIQNLVHEIEGDTIHFGEKKYFSAYCEEGKKRIIQNMQLHGYHYGVISGKQMATLHVQGSRSYQVGHSLLHPLSFIKSIFSKHK